jgi:hypothetical protein
MPTSAPQDQNPAMHTVAAIKDFTGEFGAIYAKMFLKLVD